MDSLRTGTFVVSYCTVCKKKNWPPYEYCSLCYRKTSTANISKVGRVVEFSTSRLGGEVVVALINMDGILILGSILGSPNITIGSKVVLTACGASPSLYFHFRLQEDRFDSYTKVVYPDSVMSYDRFVDDRLLTSRDALNTTQMKIKLLEIDEGARDFSQRFGRRVLVKKVLLTMKYSKTEEIEELELDLELFENKLRKERLFSSSNRWVSPNEIKNGYVVANRHLDLLADAIALDILSF